MSVNPNPDLVREFLDAFEAVFDRDWAYTKANLGIRDATEEQKKAALKLAEILGTVLEETPEDATFIHPMVEDEFDDWHNRGRLLAAYRALKKEVL